MTTHKSNSSLAVAIAMLIAATAGIQYSPAAAAQEAADALEEVIVTASRREENLQDVAMAVSVVDVGQYIDAGLSNLTDILPFVPGVSVTNGGGPFGNAVYVRGVNAVLSAGVTSYVDEIPFGSSTVYTYSTPLDGTLLDLGTLDVLKGPQGTLYGASAIGGVLKFNTREASLNDWTGSLAADLSSTDNGGLNQLYRLNANGPLAQDAVGMSFTAFWDDKSGYIDNVNIPRDGWDDHEYYGGSGSLRWLATDKLEITLQGLYQKSTQDGLATIQANYGQDALLPGKGPAEPWYGEYETGEGDINPSEFEAELYGLTIDYALDFAKLTSVTSYQESFFLNSADVSLIYGPLFDLFYPAEAPHTAYFVGDLGFEKWTQELRLTSESNEQFEWIVGGFYSSEDGHNIQRLDSVPPHPEFYAANFPSGFDQWALFATGTWYFRPDLDGSVGVRYSDYSNDVRLDVVGPLVAPIPQTSLEDSVTTYMFNLRYRPSETMSIYGRIASGYRPGGANFQLLDPVTGEPFTDEFFLPDELWSYEFGIKGTSGDGRLGYDVALFYVDWTDYIINVTRRGVNVAGNADSATSAGFEGSLSYAVTDAFTLSGMVSYTNAELAADEPDLGAADGTRLPNTPEWQVAFSADYRFTLTDRPAYVGAAWRYKGDMWVGFPGYTDSTGAYWQPSAPRVDIDGYNLVDLRGGMEFGPIDLSLYVTNLFNEWAYASFAPTFSGPSLGTPTRPRTFGVVARWNFF